MVPITRAYARVCREADALFVRGMVPYASNLYALARWYPPAGRVTLGRRQSHRAHEIGPARRAAHRCRLAALRLARTGRLPRWGRRLTGGALVCNGRELGEIFKSPRGRVVTVSSTVTDEEFFERTDTCLAPPYKILFIGIPRPEKGLQ